MFKGRFILIVSSLRIIALFTPSVAFGKQIRFPTGISDTRRSLKKNKYLKKYLISLFSKLAGTVILILKRVSKQFLSQTRHTHTHIYIERDRDREFCLLPFAFRKRVGKHCETDITARRTVRHLAKII